MKRSPESIREISLPRAHPHVPSTMGMPLTSSRVELHGLTPVAPLHALRRAKPSDLRRQKPTSDGEGRRVSSFAKATEDTLFAFLHGLTPVAFCEGG
ncbi:MAG TPA: hypothetical protein VEG60_22480, partial [Candidatus Binatia bacterium]|nr:hypothetical protein [Candidatus Binatia bacterium]